jgi:hypothetical protein
MSIAPESESRLAVSIVGGIFGLIAALIPIVDTWLRGRGAQHRLANDLEHACKQVEFWKAWLEVKALSCSPEELQQANLIATEHLAEIAKGQKTSPRERTRPDLPVSGFRRALLLYKPRRLATWIPRVFFYGFLTYFVAATIVSSVDGSLKDPLAWMLVLVVASFVSLTRYLSIRMDATNSVS